MKTPTSTTHTSTTPDGNMIELVYHPLGLVSSGGESVELVHDTENVRWTQIDGFVEAAYADSKVLSA